MKLSPSLVLTRKIVAATPRAAHDPAAVDELARLILEVGAIAHPLVVARNGLDEFKLLDGELAYHGAARARELDPIAAESVSAFVVGPENEAALRRQLALLGHSAPPPRPADVDQTLVARVEQRVDQQFHQLKRLIQDELLARVPQHRAPLELLNEAGEQELLRALRATGGNAANLCLAIQEARPFRSFADAVHRVKGLSEARMVKLLDECAGHPVVAPEKPTQKRARQLVEA
jgi:hypothetical protein